ncbi:MAG: hypothetical protein L6406_00080 [Desulfobacterales bacterium]|nr:hypothetical protein [Pseudomonadota bacterium]MCG2774052.1 hypothetical protein [Desulfobacterales bacterium]
MKNLSAISKKGIIFISAAIMITAGVLIALSPSTSRAMTGMTGTSGDGGKMGNPGWGSVRTSGSGGDIHVPILNNAGETLTIRGMYIDTPGADELRVRTICFVGEVDNSYEAGSSGYSQRRNGQTSEPNRIISFDSDNYYGFENAKVECQITFDNDPLPPGIYTIEYYFRFEGDTEDRMNEVTFNL